MIVQRVDARNEQTPTTIMVRTAIHQNRLLTAPITEDNTQSKTPTFQKNTKGIILYYCVSKVGTQV